MYRVVIITNNTVLYIGMVLREKIFHILATKKEMAIM